MVQSGVPAQGEAALPNAPRTHEADRALRSVPLFSGLGERSFDRVRRIVRTRGYSAGQIVFQKGDPSEALLIVVTGRIVVSSPSAGGAEVILNIIDPGEVVGEIGFLDGGPRTADATAERGTRAMVLMRSDFLPVLEGEPNAARWMLRLLCARLRQTTSFVEDAVLQALPGRLLHRMQALGRSYGQVGASGSGVRIEHGLSQQELGDSIGASRVSVNKQMNAWRAQGLLDFGRGFVVVPDMARLEAAVRGS